MAKRKNVEAEVDETPAVQTENIETAEEPQTETVEEVADNEVPEAPKEDKPTKKTKTAKAETEIPANILSILKVFKRYPELYVTKSGGVFTPGTKLPEHQGAILYKNPFYNN